MLVPMASAISSASISCCVMQGLCKKLASSSEQQEEDEKYWVPHSPVNEVHSHTSYEDSSPASFRLERTQYTSLLNWTGVIEVE